MGKRTETTSSDVTEGRTRSSERAVDAATLRAKAKQARRLADGITDRRVQENLSRYAEELEAQARRVEGGAVLRRAE